MDLFEYINPNPYPVQIKGPDGQSITFKKLEKKVLDSFFKRYCPRYLAAIGAVGSSETKIINIAEDKKRRKLITPSERRAQRRRKISDDKVVDSVQARPKPSLKRKKIIKSRNFDKRKIAGRKIVGKKKHANSKEATQHLQNLIKMTNIPISNDIGIGILSFNRLECIKRLLDSIRKCTDSNRITVFVSDESSDNKVKKYLRNQKDIVLLDNKERLGVAGNTNRLLRCLERFNHKLLLNDDVEVLRPGWDQLYFAAMKETGYHHFCMRQSGVYGASDVRKVIRRFNTCAIFSVDKKPHGAVLAIDDAAFKKVGYFDESFGIYGMEHVDWSNRVSLSGLQPTGFHDVLGAEGFFKIHNEASAVQSTERSRHLRDARSKYDSVKDNKSRIFVNASPKSEVKGGVSYIVPFSGADRQRAVRTVLNNIKSQKFPLIEILLVEQSPKRILSYIPGIECLWAKGHNKLPFTKSMACNLGAIKASHNIIIIHDADMVVQDDYTQRVVKALRNYDSCHICNIVTYLNDESTNRLVMAGYLSNGMVAKMSVGYFEGGSLACIRKKYIEIGGFNESFIGYGCEDCEFYERLVTLTNCYAKRSVNLIHLEHSRTSRWEQHHEKNKRLHARLKSMKINVRIDKLKSDLRKKYPKEMEKF